jgi:hypothetical protein
MNLVSGWLVAAIGLLILISYLIIRAGTKAPMKFIRWGSFAVAITAVFVGLQMVVQFLWGTVISISVVTSQFWPKPPKGFNYESNASADYVSGGFSNAVVEVVGVSAGPRVMFAIAAILLTIVVVSIAQFVRRVFTAIELGSTLSRALVNNASFTGWIVLIAGTVSSLLNVIGNNFAQAELLGSQRSFGWDPSQDFNNPWATGDSMNSDGVYGFLMPNPQYVIEFWPIAIAIGLLLIAKVIRRANKLEQEVEGLV